MGEPSLAWTITAKDKMDTLMEEKMWIKFTQNSDYAAWATWANTSGSATQKDVAAKYDGRAMDFIVSTKWLSDWPTPDGVKYF